MKNLGKILALGSAVLLASCASSNFNSSKEPVANGFPVYQSSNSSISLIGETDKQVGVDYINLVFRKEF